MRKLLVLLAFLICIASACSSDQSATSSDSNSDPSESTLDAAAVSANENDPADTSASTSGNIASQSSSSNESTDGQAKPTSTTAANSKSPLTTQPYQIGAGSGQTMVVIAVAYNDTLNFRTDPDASSSIVVSVPPLATDPAIISQGQGVLTGNGAWWNVEVGGAQAWANASFLATLGSSLSITNEVLPKLPSQQAATVELLAKSVADTRTGDPVKTTIVQEPEAGDAIGGEVIFDATGYLDDAVQGERITMQYKFVWDNPASSSRKVVAYEFLSASSQALCSRGTSNGVCN